MLIDKDGYITRCDWCGIVKDTTDCRNHNDKYICSECPDCVDFSKSSDLTRHHWAEIFKIPGRENTRGVLLPFDFPKDLCYKCAKEVTPLVVRFADIKLVNTFNNWLKDAINDKRKKSR